MSMLEAVEPKPTDVPEVALATGQINHDEYKSYQQMASEIRNIPKPVLLQTGDIVLFSGKGLMARAIKHLTKSKYSHVGIVFRVFYNAGELLLAEAVDDGFILNRYPIDYITTNCKIGYIFDNLPHDDRTRMRECITRYLCYPYDHSALYHIFCSIVFNDPFRYESSKKLICSESVARAYHSYSNNIDLRPDNKGFDETTPQDISVHRLLLYRN